MESKEEILRKLDAIERELRDLRIEVARRPVPSYPVPTYPVPSYPVYPIYPIYPIYPQPQRQSQWDYYVPWPGTTTGDASQHINVTTFLTTGSAD